MTPIRLTTERLELIPLDPEQLRMRIDDLPALEAELNCRYQAEPLSEWFLNIIKGQADITGRDPEHYPFHSFWFLIRQEDRAVVGSADFKDVPDEKGAVEIGYGMGADFTGHGYMTEAVRAMVDWAFQQPNVLSVTAETENNGIASQRVLTRCGFHQTSKGSTVWRQRIKE